MALLAPGPLGMQFFQGFPVLLVLLRGQYLFYTGIAVGHQLVHGFLHFWIGWRWWWWVLFSYFIGCGKKLFECGFHGSFLGRGKGYFFLQNFRGMQDPFFGRWWFGWLSGWLWFCHDYKSGCEDAEQKFFHVFYFIPGMCPVLVISLLFVQMYRSSCSLR